MRKLAAAALALVGFWLGMSLFFFPSYATRATDNPVVTAPSDVGLNYQDVVIHSDGLALPGWWMPAANPRAVLMFVHGAGSSRTSHFIDSLNLYAAFVMEDISVLTIDLRNHGNAPKTDGHWTMGLEEHRDLLAMSLWLDDHTDQSVPRLAMGASMGGATVIHALANGLAVDGVILLDPALNTADSLAQGGRTETGLPSVLFQPYAWAATTFYGLPKGESDAGALITDVKQPILLIQDPDDPVTRLPFAKAAADTNPMIQLVTAAPVPQGADCLRNKGRWGTHVAAFKCDSQWTMNTVNKYLHTVGLNSSAL
jgi:fermentation-respiration switch protein FrsA (DUF1100 family)